MNDHHLRLVGDPDPRLRERIDALAAELVADPILGLSADEAYRAAATALVADLDLIRESARG